MVIEAGARLEINQNTLKGKEVVKRSKLQRFLLVYLLQPATWQLEKLQV